MTAQSLQPAPDLAPAPNPWVGALHAYVPGEQPREPGWVKLNTNENPYPAAPEVLEAVRAAAAESAFQKYPDPTSSALRRALAEHHGVTPEQVLVGNGSDEVLRLLCHAYLRPVADGTKVSGGCASAGGDRIGMVHPTYSLYRTIAAMFGCETEQYDPTTPDYAIPVAARDADVRILFIANPNPPIGTFYSNDDLATLAAANPQRLVVIDEAYADFAPGDAIGVMRQYPNVVITRTFSKSYSLAGLRVGYCIAHEPVIEQLEKIRDSYNVNRISQAAAMAALDARDYHRDACARIRADRDWLAEELRRRDFDVPPSHGNFVFARRVDTPALYARLREKKVLVRYFGSDPTLTDGLRITVGTRQELEVLLGALDGTPER